MTTNEICVTSNKKAQEVIGALKLFNFPSSLIKWGRLYRIQYSTKDVNHWGENYLKLKEQQRKIRVAIYKFSQGEISLNELSTYATQ